LSVSQPTKAIRPCSVCSILSFVCKQRMNIRNLTKHSFYM
jgi:hypothetical protein